VKVFARKCRIAIVTKDTYREFYNTYHIQGSINSKHTYGLYFGEDLVSDEQVTIKNPLYFELKWLEPGDNKFTIITDKKPLKAGIDPYNKLIDRNSDDNLKSIEE
jgi:hypothetical protein